MASNNSAHTRIGKGDEYDALVEAMAEMRQQGVEIPPAVQNLITQLYNQKKTAEGQVDNLASRHLRLQAEHKQLVVEFNKFCNDADESWQTRAKNSLDREMRKTVESASVLNRVWRNTMDTMFTEYMNLNNEASRLRKENMALKAELGEAKCK
ncbi:hypothetical protein F5B20DRAFT_578103 [Whalleya microplaca]|nr:hypothetical protein F5B20DRAFT_578103 [Whalleya microplaca]